MAKEGAVNKKEEGLTDEHLNDSGWLDVGDGHEIYWEDWGNARAKMPIMFLHGGPGAGVSESNKALFDPVKQRVIFFDQRGSGRSKPYASTERNTTQDLVADMERLREQFGFEKMYVMGGSWGSTLALFYTIAHPERVERLMLRSLYLARKGDTDWVNAGGPKFARPEEWERFVGLVPEEERESGDQIMRHYAQKMRVTDAAEARKYAMEWNLWEGALMSLEYDPQLLEEEARDDPRMLAVALIETHYFMNACFVPENYILDNLDKIRQIPCDLVHGRFDLCTPPSGAYDLAKAYGENLNLVWVNAGHAKSDPAMFEALKLLVREHLK